MFLISQLYQITSPFGLNFCTKILLIKIHKLLSLLNSRRSTSSFLDRKLIFSHTSGYSRFPHHIFKEGNAWHEKQTKPKWWRVHYIHSLARHVCSEAESGVQRGVDEHDNEPGSHAEDERQECELELITSGLNVSHARVLQRKILND